MVFLKRYWLLIVAPILVVLAVLLAIRIVGSMDYHHQDNDFFTFWLAGHLVTLGGSPYDPAQWVAGYHQFEIGFIPNKTFLYPLPLALLLAPLGFLPFHTAYIVWVTLIQLMIIVSLAVLLSLESHPRAKFFFIPLLAGIILFRPTILTLIQGQVSGLILFILAWIVFLWRKGNWFWGGLLLGLLALKPNLGIIIIVLLAIWLILQKRWAALFGTLTCGIFILIAGLVVDRNWVSEYWRVGANKLAETFGGSPTVWGLGALISHNHAAATLIIGGLVGLMILLGFFRVILRSRPALSSLGVSALIVTVTLLIAPYTWTYDQLLLVLPITAMVLAMDRMGAPFPLTFGIFLGIDALCVILLIFNTMYQVEILNVVIPIIVFGLCLWWLTPRVSTKRLKEQ
jgi:arabinofuranan 3-O-arabinosyltransferase